MTKSREPTAREWSIKMSLDAESVLGSGSCRWVACLGTPSVHQTLRHALSTALGHFPDEPLWAGRVSIVGMALVLEAFPGLR
jgi:hypothetical protein